MTKYIKDVFDNNKALKDVIVSLLYDRISKV